jgi:hypothetical protein
MPCGKRYAPRSASLPRARRLGAMRSDVRDGVALGADRKRYLPSLSTVATDKLIDASIQWAERIMERIDCRFGER